MTENYTAQTAYAESLERLWHVVCAYGGEYFAQTPGSFRVCEGEGDVVVGYVEKVGG